MDGEWQVAMASIFCPEPSEPSAADLGGAAVAGIVVGSIAGLLLLAAVGWQLVWKQRKSSAAATAADRGEEDEHPAEGVVPLVR